MRKQKLFLLSLALLFSSKASSIDTTLSAHSPPLILNKSGEIVVGAGSNKTLACTAQGSPPLTFVWFQDERNLTVQDASNSQVEPPQPPSTKLLEEKRYGIQEELSPPNLTTSYLYLINLKVTDTSVFLCWVQNDAGYSIANFSLIVDLSRPVQSTGAISGLGNSLGRIFGVEPSNTLQIVFVVLVSLLLLAATIICLFVLKGRSSKSTHASSSSNIKDSRKQLNAATSLNNNSKFKQAKGKLGAGSDNDDDDGRFKVIDDDHLSSCSTSSTQSSCANQSSNYTRVLAAEELNGCINHLRSGIINMDYHSMSPVILFNNQKPRQQQQAVMKKVQQQHYHY